MTGYGEARATVDGIALFCRVKSVNHRFLDAKVRLPRADLLSLDAAVRKRLADTFKRGAVELSLSIESSAAVNGPQINAKAAAQYWEDLQRLARDLSAPKKSAGAKKGKSAKKSAAPLSLTVSLDSLLRLPGVVGSGSNEESTQLGAEHDEQVLSKLVQPALDALKAARIAEGKRLADHLLGLLDEMDAHVAEIKKHEQPEKEKGRQLMIERAHETLKLLASLAPGVEATASDAFASRLREEAVFWIERRDFDEERMRLSMHLKDFRAQIMSPTELSGRKLEFIQQEILREINTLGTKAQSPAITTHTIELKTILERIREQLANVA